MTRNPYQTLTGRKRSCYIHFARRMHERVKPKVKAREAYQTIVSAIKTGDTSQVTFVARLNRKGRRMWRVEMGGAVFFIVFDHDLGVPVTALPRNGHVQPQGRNLIYLEGMR